MAKVATPKTVNLRSASTRTLRLGLLSCKVGTGPMADTSARIAAKMLDPDTLTPLKQQYVNEAGEAIPHERRLKGYPVEGGFVVLDEDEKPAELDADGSIELVASIASVPPEYVLGTALVWPSETSADEVYALVAQYLAATGRALVGTTVASGTTKVVAVRWSGAFGCVVMHTLVYDEQVRHANITTITEGLAKIADPNPQMAAMAAKLFGTLPETFDFAGVEDEYGTALAAAVEAKAAGQPVAQAQGKAPAPKADDLMAALEASLAAVNA